ncbi:class I SAM-dependent methyltransferase [bacterium]|nr:class I SAM-dependent methyltransferase [bacterium]
MRRASELKRLSRVAARFSPWEGFNSRLLDYQAAVLRPLCRGKRVLEIGCADGGVTVRLAPAARSWVGLDGSDVQIRRARRRGGRQKWRRRVRFECSLFESYAPEQKFDVVLLGHVLEHVQRPVDLLRRAASWTAYGGRLFVIVPNAHSFHRRVGVAMGLLSRLTALNSEDRRAGHRRVYTPDRLRSDLRRAGLKIEKWGGIVLKPLSNAQMRTWPKAITDELYRIGVSIPEWCSELFAVCRPE